jgi:hypothetical protein
MKSIVISCVLIICLVSAGFAQETGLPKRMLTKNEITQLKTVRDSILYELKLIYSKEISENSPGKYQPQRIALVREYLLLFGFMSDRLDVIRFNTQEVINIVGKPDRIFDEAGYQIYEYTSLNRPYLRLKNLKYHLVFNNNELVFVHTK